MGRKGENEYIRDQSVCSGGKRSSRTPRRKEASGKTQLTEAAQQRCAEAEIKMNRKWWKELRKKQGLTALANSSSQLSFVAVCRQGC